jgi:hypothetical protein
MPLLHGSLSHRTGYIQRVTRAEQLGKKKRAGSAVVEEKGSHAIYVSRPEAVAKLIETAAKSR